LKLDFAAWTALRLARSAAGTAEEPWFQNNHRGCWRARECRRESNQSMLYLAAFL